MAGYTQFTPQQVLEAGRRAEADGKLDYAVQFYSHVVSRNAESNEAREAAEALYRLGAPLPEREPPAPQPNGEYPAQPGLANNFPVQHGPIVRGTAPRPGFTTYPLQAASGNGYDAAHLADGSHQPYPEAAPRTQWPSIATLPAPADSVRTQPGSQRPKAEHAKVADAEHARTHARVQHRQRTKRAKAPQYRLGRVMAAIVGLSGVMASSAGVIGLGAYVAAVAGKQALGPIAALTLSPTVGLGLVVVGCVLMLLQQVAKATFDMAAHAGEGHGHGHEDD